MSNTLTIVAGLVVEEWANAAALEYHFSLPRFTHVAAVLEEILAEPFTLRRLGGVSE